jgi:lambda repressor-like predicted transcriptional regulator
MPKPFITPPYPKEVKAIAPEELPDLSAIVPSILHSQGRTLTQLAKVLGMHKSSLGKSLKRRNLTIAQLMALSKAIGFNMLDVYLIRMPEHLKATSLSNNLGLQLDAKDLELEQLRQELQATQRERDVYLDLLKSGR